MGGREQLPPLHADDAVLYILKQEAPFAVRESELRRAMEESGYTSKQTDLGIKEGETRGSIKRYNIRGETTFGYIKLEARQA
jgi:hypothetical protein